MTSAPSGLPRARSLVPARVLGWPCPPRARALHLRADGRARARPRPWSRHALTCDSSVAPRGRQCSGRMLHSPLRGLFRMAPPHCRPRCAPSHLRCRLCLPEAAWPGPAHRPFPDASGGTNGTSAAPLASVACQSVASGRPRQPALRSAVGPGLSHALARSLARSTALVPLVPPLAFVALPCACAGRAWPHPSAAGAAATPPHAGSGGRGWAASPRQCPCHPCSEAAWEPSRRRGGRIWPVGALRGASAPRVLKYKARGGLRRP